jgi:predicted nucleotidyltransferase
MDPTDGVSGVLADLERTLCQDPDVEFAVVFGSQTAETSHSTADVDIAVKFADGLTAGERFRKRCFLADDLQREDAPFLDVSDVEALPLDVAHDAVTGELLCGDEQRFREFKSGIESAFSEQSEDIRRRQRDTIDRIAEDGLRG